MTCAAGRNAAEQVAKRARNGMHSLPPTVWFLVRYRPLDYSPSMTACAAFMPATTALSIVQGKPVCTKSDARKIT